MLDASGELFEDVFQGAHVQVIMKHDRTVMVSRSDDLCQQLERQEGDKITCTVKKGLIKVIYIIESVLSTNMTCKQISQKFTVPKTTPPVCRFYFIF